MQLNYYYLIAMIEVKAFSISAGIFRFVCANGLVISDNVFEAYKIKHLGEEIMM